MSTLRRRSPISTKNHILVDIISCFVIASHKTYPQSSGFIAKGKTIAFGLAGWVGIICSSTATIFCFS